MEVSEVGSGIASALMLMVSLLFAVLPLVFAVWVFVRLSAMSQEMTLMRRQLGAIAEHAGAAVVPEPVVRPRSRGPLWAYAAVLVVFLLVVGLLLVLVPTRQQDGVMHFESGAGGSSSVTVPTQVPVEDATP